MKLIFSCTNESLQAIVKGLSLNEGDIVLAVGGSGDQPFAILEHSGVIAVDKNPEQVKFIQERAKALESNNYEGFFSEDKRGSGEIIHFLKRLRESRRNYFDEERLRKIQGRLQYLKLYNGDIFEVAEKEEFTKVYLSNTLSYERPGTDEIKKNLDLVALRLPEGGLVYVADHDFLASMFVRFVSREKNDDLKITSFLSPYLTLDEELTLKAREYEDVWRPAVYRKC